MSAPISSYMARELADVYTSCGVENVYIDDLTECRRIEPDDALRSLADQIDALRAELAAAKAECEGQYKITLIKEECGVQYLTERDAALAKLAEMEKQKNMVYHERDQLVAALAKQFPASLERHPEHETWDDDWRWIIFIDLPTGQVSWHIHDSELLLFSHVPRRGWRWDGHSTEEKYRRLNALTAAGVAWEQG